MNGEQDYLLFQEYVERKRKNTAPGLGHLATNLLLAPVGMGVIEAANPRGAELKSISNESLDYTPQTLNSELGELSVRQLVMVDKSAPRQAVETLEQRLKDQAELAREAFDLARAA